MVLFFAFGGTSIDKKIEAPIEFLANCWIDIHHQNQTPPSHKVVNNESVIHIKSSNSYSYCFDFSK